jgi:anti-sigma factor RsiW
MMNCDEVRERLVALHDDELSPSEAVQVREHVARCASCTGTERALVEFRPTPPAWRPPDAVRDRLDRALDPALLFALAEAPIPVAHPTPKRAFWPGVRRATSVPLGAVVMYVVLLVGSFAWGVSNWWTLNTLPEPTVAGAPAPAPGTAIVRPPAPDAVGGTAIPADQFRPAAWDPSAEAGGR